MIMMSMGNKKPISFINTLRNRVRALYLLTRIASSYLFLLEIGIQNNTSSIASNIEASLTKPHNLHHGVLFVSKKRM